jgi:chromatin assembly factor 1 subunit A
MRAKLLQFHDNNRPAYYGTWRKHSRIINPRNPLQRDTSVFDYEVDSDDEWEEEEPGESLSHSEDDDDDETEAEQDEEGDGFFVPHGYLSEGEGCEDDEEELGISPEKRKARQLARASKWEADIAKKADVLHPIVIGINWWNPNAACDSLSKLQEFKVILFDKAPIATVNPADEASNGKLEGNDKRSKGPTYIPVPEAALQDLARLVHGNERSIKKLVREFCEFWFHKTATDQMSIEAGCRKCMISKGRLKRKIQEIAVYELRSQYPRRKLWYVNSDMLKALNLSDLPVPTEWHWITKLPSNGSSDDKKVYPETGDKPSLQLCSIKSYLTSQMDDKVDHTS